MKVLILCTGNSCRSQMAEGILKKLKPSWLVKSAGTKPAEAVHPKAVQVMKELGIDISGAKPEHTDKYIGDNWDTVITVCGDAEEKCPLFTGNVKEKLHIGFFDPAKAEGSEEEVYKIFQDVRDEIKIRFTEFADAL